ncbi:MAG: hypothetical protein ACOCRX_05315 [Candidatus Woesearchaeota archaeon]
MAHSKWCGKKCNICEEFCDLDLSMLCSPDCKAIDPSTNGYDLSLCYKCGANLLKITNEEASYIIDKRVPIGKFYIEDGDMFVGIDNETGDAWTKNFKSKDDCLKWLYGLYEL